MIKCIYKCGEEAVYVDNDEDYICEECMKDITTTGSTGQVREDFKTLDWDKFPTYGYKE